MKRRKPSKNEEENLLHLLIVFLALTFVVLFWLVVAIKTI